MDIGLNRESRRSSALSDSWKRTLAGIPTLLGRLEYLASLRNPHTGQYEHFGIVQKMGSAEADAMIRQSHAEMFQEWLCLQQARQREEAQNYLEQMEGDKREIVSNWLALRPYVNWVPAGSSDVERELFLTDLEDVVEAIRTEYRVASRDPEL